MDEVSNPLTDFGFPIDIHAHRPDTIYVVPIKARLREHYPPDGKLPASIGVARAANEWKRDQGAAAGLLRLSCGDAMAVDTSIRAGSTSARRRAGVCVGGCGRYVVGHRARPAASLVCRSVTRRTRCRSCPSESCCQPT